MDDLIVESEGHLAKISLLESFISLHLRRDRIEPQIEELSKKTEEVKSLVQQCNQIMKVEYNSVMQDYKFIMQKMQEQQLQVLNILIEKQSNSKANEFANISYGGGRTPKSVLKENQLKSWKKGFLTVPSAQKILEASETPTMSLEYYLQSPFVKKTKLGPLSLKFLDFEVEITPEMFENIPKYMRGRENLDELQHFLDAILVPCFNEKYQLLHRHRDCIRNHVDLDLWKVYKDQTSYFPGQHFITQGDISRKTMKMLDKKSQNKITMLRHLGILQEQRKAQTVCYIWTANSIQ